MAMITIVLTFGRFCQIRRTDCSKRPDFGAACSTAAFVRERASAPLRSNRRLPVRGHRDCSVVKGGGFPHAAVWRFEQAGPAAVRPLWLDAGRGVPSGLRDCGPERPGPCCRVVVLSSPDDRRGDFARRYCRDSGRAFDCGCRLRVHIARHAALHAVPGSGGDLGHGDRRDRPVVWPNGAGDGRASRGDGRRGRRYKSHSRDNNIDRTSRRRNRYWKSHSHSRRHNNHRTGHRDRSHSGCC